jgi:hypothetical protein
MNKEVINYIFQSIEAIGALATFGAFIFLFRRDKDKQSQIDRLTGILTILEAQNDTMKKHNNLIEQQVSIFRNTSILQGKDNGALIALREIEEKKLKLSVKPNLWLNGAGYSGSTGELSIGLNNKGEVAMLQKFELKSDDIELHNHHLPYELEKGERRYIYGRTKNNKHIMDSQYEIDVEYIDKIGNKYMSKISGNGSNAKIIETKEIEAVN